MKKSSLLFALLLAFPFAFSSCNKDDDDPAPPPVVGVWELDRFELSDLPATYSELNGVGYDNYLLFARGTRIEVKSDKSFSQIDKSEGFVFDLDGTWNFTNNTLNLNYTEGDIDDVTLIYDPAKMRLYGEKIAVSDSLVNPITDQLELVGFNIQEVYVKN